MGYSVALEKAWEDLIKLNPQKTLSLTFLADTYTVNPQDKKVVSLSCNAAAKDFTAILILHYLIQKLKGLPKLSNAWVSFRELSAGEGYYPAFRQRAIAPIIRKYGANHDGILSILERLPAKKVNQGDVGIVLGAFEAVPVLITLWRQDEEFKPEANMLFDESITRIFCTEDIAVLAGIVAGAL